MSAGECPNCGAHYGADEMVCSYCGAPIKREPEGYGGFGPQSYQTSNGGTQVIQNIYVTNGNVGGTAGGASIGNINVNPEPRMSRSGEVYSKSRSRVLAAILAIIFGWIGAQFFYLNKPVLGVFCIIFCSSGIPAVIGVIHGVLLLKMSDAEFESKYHVQAS